MSLCVELEAKVVTTTPGLLASGRGMYITAGLGLWAFQQVPRRGLLRAAPRMALGVCHEGGITWDVKWCPSTGPEDQTGELQHGPKPRRSFHACDGALAAELPYQIQGSKRWGQGMYTFTLCLQVGTAMAPARPAIKMFQQHL